MGRVYTDRNDEEEGAGAREGISIIAIDESLGQGSGRGGGAEAVWALLAARAAGCRRCRRGGGGSGSLLPAAAAGAALFWSAARFALGGF